MPLILYSCVAPHQVLKLVPTDAEKTIIDSANSLIELEIITLKKKKAKKGKQDKAAASGDEPAAAATENGAVAENGDAKPTELEPEDKKRPEPPTSEVPVEIAAN